MLVLICWETLKSVAMAMNFGVLLLGYMNTVDKRLSKQVINQSTLQNEVAMAMTYILRFKGWCKHHWRHCHCRILKTKSCPVYVNCQRPTSLCSKTQLELALPLTVGANKKFTLRLRSMVVLQCNCSSKMVWNFYYRSIIRTIYMYMVSGQMKYLNGCTLHVCSKLFNL